MHAQPQPKLHIRMTHTKPGSENGIHIKTFAAGEDHHVCKDLARIFLEEGWAELVEHYVPTLEEVIAAGYSPEAAEAIIEHEQGAKAENTATDTPTEQTQTEPATTEPATTEPTATEPTATEPTEPTATAEMTEEPSDGDNTQENPEGAEPVKTRKGKKS